MWANQCAVASMLFVFQINMHPVLDKRYYNYGEYTWRFKEKGPKMKLEFIVSAIAVGGFIFLAWSFNHWWIALFGLLFI